MITITDAAQQRINTILAEDGVPYFRMAIQGGGCSGFSYKFDVDTAQTDDDFVYNTNVLVDYLSAQYLEGATLDYVENFLGSYFAVDNPSARTTCGCGSSFSI